MKNNTLFPNTDWKELKKRLNNLRAVCFPPVDIIRPTVQFKFKSDFDGTDMLEMSSGCYSVSPSELSTFWEDRQTLRYTNIDFICVNRKRWYYNTNAKAGDFFLEDGSRKVSLEFPYWMDMSRVIKTPGVRSSVFNILSQCMGNTFPSEETARTCFSKDLCRDIYLRNPDRKTVEMAVLEMLETLRQKTHDYLDKNHSANIAASIGFKRYANSRTFPPNTPIEQQVREYMDGEKRAMYLLGERFGVIKNADRIFRYEAIRDHVRHPQTVRERILKPQQIYEDFCMALNEPFIPHSQAKSWMRFSDNSEIFDRLNSLSIIWDILDQHVDPALKKKKNKEVYYTDLLQKGLLQQDEVKIIRARRLTCNAVAHVSTSVKRARQKVLRDTELQDLAYTLYNRHTEIMQRWINGRSRS